jgi:hypothetical protein
MDGTYLRYNSVWEKGKEKCYLVMLAVLKHHTRRM